MSGTSLDGMDLACCNFTWDGERWSYALIKAQTIAYDETWYARLKCLEDQSALAFAKTNIYYGHLLGKTLSSFISDHQLQPQFVASHGQTIFHQPNKNFTVQIGDGETIASYLSCPLVCNFRNKDVAIGGQGAPLVPFGDRYLFDRYPLCLNLGGIANISSPTMAYDVSVCNMALNWLARNHDSNLEYDVDGQLGRSGRLNPELLQALDGLPYYRTQAPKSLGAEWFQAEFMPLIMPDRIRVVDSMHTVCIHIARQVANALSGHVTHGKEVLVTGGGSHNRFLMDCMEASFRPHDLKIVQADRQTIDFKEAIIFAFLGLQTLLGKPNTMSTATGAPFDSCTGSIHLPATGWKMPLI